MAYQCPACGQEFEMQTEFCPACGGPMNPEAHRIAQKNAETNARLLPMKWFKFLIWVSIPLSILLLLYSLYGTIAMLSSFDASLYKPDLLHLVRISLYMDLAVQIVLVPAMGYCEYALVKKKWLGVKALLFIYGFQAVYAVAGMVLLFMAGGDVSGTVLSLVQMIVMLLLNRVYFNKRKSMFE